VNHRDDPEGERRADQDKAVLGLALWVAVLIAYWFGWL